jgi:hypothetical protein
MSLSNYWIVVAELYDSTTVYSTKTRYFIGAVCLISHNQLELKKICPSFYGVCKEKR